MAINIALSVTPLLPSAGLCWPLPPSATLSHHPSASAAISRPSTVPSCFSPCPILARILGRLVANMSVIKMALSVLSELPNSSRMLLVRPAEGPSARPPSTVQGSKGCCQTQASRHIYTGTRAV